MQDLADDTRELTGSILREVINGKNAPATVSENFARKGSDVIANVKKFAQITQHSKTAKKFLSF